MMKNIIGTKLGMTRIFDEEGLSIPVTIIKIDKCRIIGKRTKEKDSYSAFRVGYQEKKEKNATKPYQGQFAALEGNSISKFIIEFKVSNAEVLTEYEVGSYLTVDMFEEGDYVDVSGISRGKGFAGVMKRHGFAGLPATHGHGEYRRAPGSIGNASTPSRVFKGKKMPGRYGGTQVTIQKLTIVKIDTEEQLLLLKGSIPGVKGSSVRVKETVKVKKRGRNK
ncbi:MAG: 50S ribosomal protein L3 [bacterium]|nr:50S ribosomal protein L3 [bacterium]